MASAVSRTKLDMLLRRDFPAQAAIRDVSTITDLVVAQCEDAGGNSPLIRACASLYRGALAAGHGNEDMAAVVHAFSPARPLPVPNPSPPCR
jgi:3-hydroxyisobutyrate dehydrogenase